MSHNDVRDVIESSKDQHSRRELKSSLLSKEQEANKVLFYCLPEMFLLLFIFCFDLSFAIRFYTKHSSEKANNQMDRYNFRPIAM